MTVQNPFSLRPSETKWDAKNTLLTLRMGTVHEEEYIDFTIQVDHEMYLCVVNSPWKAVTEGKGVCLVDTLSSQLVINFAYKPNHYWEYRFDLDLARLIDYHSKGVALRGGEIDKCWLEDFWLERSHGYTFWFRSPFDDELMITYQAPNTVQMFEGAKREELSVELTKPFCDEYGEGVTIQWWVDDPSKPQSTKLYLCHETITAHPHL